MRAILIGLAALPASQPASAQDAAGDPGAGRLVAGICVTCHGLDGARGSQRTPLIGGERASYLAEQLRAFRSGEREGDAMNAIAKNLSDQQIADVSAWYASHTATPVLPEGFRTADAPEECFGCHGANGIARADGAPNLTGDGHLYLMTQLQAFASGERESETMTPIAQRLSDEEISELTGWYASIDLEVSGP